jgi:hypothetical protein
MDRRARGGRGWYWLLLVPLIGLLVPSIYNQTDPEFIGLPFFYWYQLAWVPISVAITGLVYVKTRDRA